MMSKVIQHSEMHHFEDDKNLFYSSTSMKKLNRYMNHDLKVIVHRLRSSRISLNVDKTQIIIHISIVGVTYNKKIQF